MKLQKLIEHKARKRISNSLHLKKIASVFSSICLGLSVLHKRAAISQCDIYHMYHIHAEYCRLFFHCSSVMFDYQGFAALHAKVKHTNHGCCLGGRNYFGVSWARAGAVGRWLKVINNSQKGTKPDISYPTDAVWPWHGTVCILAKKLRKL